MLFGALLPALLLTVGASAQISTKSLVTCLTKQGPKSTSSVKTTSKVLTIPWYAYRTTTFTPSTMVTPAPKTTTVSTTLTIRSTSTMPISTDIVSTTSTITSTDTSTVPATTSSRSTTQSTVFTTDTTTIAASAGFIAIETSIPGSLKRRADEGLAEDAPKLALEARQTANRVKISAKNGKIVCDPPIYPQSVNCVGLVAVVTTTTKTKTASKTKTIIAATPIVTSTTTFTTSTTIIESPPRASTTTTFTTTSTTTTITTTTSTSVSTVTDVVTVVAPQATFYAACAENNIITTIGGQGISGATVSTETGQTFVSADSAYDCCVACINTANCGSAAYFLGSNTCDLITSTSSVCSQGNVVAFLQAGGSSAFAFSNGYCGFATA